MEARKPAQPNAAGPTPVSAATIAPPGPARKMRLGEALVHEGFVTEEQLSRTLAQQRSTGRMLGELLVEQNIINGAQLVHLLARNLGVKGCQIRHGLIDPTL